MKKGKRILVCPLDWGLGHATRCVPVVRELLAKDCEVLIASSGSALALLKKEFPELTFFTLTGYRPYYSVSGLIMPLALQLFKFHDTIQREHRETQAIVRNEKIDIIISDNRYGCWSNEIPSVIMTHQLTIPVPMFSFLINHYNHKQLRKFSTIWVPDWQGEDSLAGMMSANAGLRVTYIGSLSRFKAGVAKKTYDIVVIASGPEPQRTLFENLMRKELSASGKKTLLIKGKPEGAQESLGDSTTEVNHLDTTAMNAVLAGADLVISRSGYSTVMDLSRLHKKAIFVATPGQPEQLYLAERLMKRKITFAMSQVDFNLQRALSENERYTGFTQEPFNVLLAKAIDELLTRN